MSSLQDILDASQFPCVEKLHHGHLIWCRAKDSIVVRGSEPAETFDGARYGPTTRGDWDAERDGFIRRTATHNAASAEASDAARNVKDATLEWFLERYRGDLGGGLVSGRGPTRLDSQTVISTGHVAIIAVDDTGRRLVVEAARPKLLPPKPYGEWLQRFHKPFFVYQGCVQSVPDPGLAAAAANLARDWAERQYSDAPFSLWNFDLDDPSAFYCAKFVWMAVYRASGRTVGLDGDVEPHRRFLQWCTPRALLRSRHIRLLFDPEAHAAVDAGRTTPIDVRRSMAGPIS